MVASSSQDVLPNIGGQTEWVQVKSKSDGKKAIPSVSLELGNKFFALTEIPEIGVEQSQS